MRDFGVGLDSHQEQFLIDSSLFTQPFDGSFLCCFAPFILGWGDAAAKVSFLHLLWVFLVALGFMVIVVACQVAPSDWVVFQALSFAHSISLYWER